MSLASRLLGLSGTRADAPDARANARPPKGGASSTWYTSPGMPQVPEWDGLTAIRNGYQASIWIMQPTRIIATALGSLPFRVGPDPGKPGEYDVNAPMARLLGPPQGGRNAQGPNPATSPRNLWIWSLVQRLITGRMAWETVTAPGMDAPGALWPLVAPFLDPIPSQPGSARWYDGYQYRLPTGTVPYRPDEVFYSWRPAQHDWRQPESALQAANMPASLQIALDRYMWALAKNGLSARKLVITPDFAEDDERRAWEEQFAAEFTGYDSGGRVMHGYYEDDPNTPATGNRTPPIQVVDLATTPTDAGVVDILKAVRDDMLATWRVPMSWMGNSADRTYENASQEAKNFWQGPVMELAAEVCDDLNTYLAPRFGDGLVGWFDFSTVEALKGTSIFGPIDPVAGVQNALITADDWRNDVGLPPLNPADKASQQLPAIDDTPGGTSMSNFSRRDTSGTVPAAPKAAGLAVKALDTGRVLLLQRALVDGDPAAGTWEFPGGCLEQGEHPLAAAVREWQEETGCVLPAGQVAGSWTSPDGVYVGYVYLVPSEDAVDINCDGDDRHVLNPDDPDGDQAEVVAWWNPAVLPGMAALRPEVRTGTDWDLLATAGMDGDRAAWDATKHPRMKKGAPGGGQFAVVGYGSGYDTSTARGRAEHRQVQDVQTVLNRLGFRDLYGRRLAVDGMFGPLTRSAVEAFQRAHGLKPTGSVDRRTLDALGAAKPRAPRRRPAHRAADGEGAALMAYANERAAVWNARRERRLAAGYRADTLADGFDAWFDANGEWLASVAESA